VPSALEEEEVKLAVVRRPGSRLDPGELIEFCQEKLPRHMVPRYLEFVDELPRTPTDKIAKYRLRAEGDHGITERTWDREAVAGDASSAVDG
jgi:carnitine-CoA ligase